MQGAHSTTIVASQLLMLTIARKCELLRSTWQEFDLDAVVTADDIAPQPTAAGAAVIAAGQPLMAPMTSLYEDTNNLRTEFPEAELEGVEDGGHDAVTQWFRARCVLPPAVRPDGQAQGQHRHRAQARADGLLRADPR